MCYRAHRLPKARRFWQAFGPNTTRGNLEQLLIGTNKPIEVGDGGADRMRLKRVGILLIAALLASGRAHGEDSVSANVPPASYDWLSPNPLAWTLPNTFNWSESPIRINAHEYVGYNDNILNQAQNYQLPPGQRAGDPFTKTSVGASTMFYAGAQQFFGDASYTVTNYRHDTALDLHNYSFDGGLNWQVTSRCQGKLVGAARSTEAPLEEQAGPGIDIVQFDLAE